MKKYNIPIYLKYKQEVEDAWEDVNKPIDGDYTRLTNDEIIINFLPLVENIARKQSTSDQASGILSILDLIQEGNAGLIAATNKLDRETLMKSDDQEKTLKSFLSKRIKGAIRRAVDMNRGEIRIPEHKLNEIRRNPKDERLVSMFFNSASVNSRSTATAVIALLPLAARPKLKAPMLIESLANAPLTAASIPGLSSF